MQAFYKHLDTLRTGAGTLRNGGIHSLFEYVCVCDTLTARTSSGSKVTKPLGEKTSSSPPSIVKGTSTCPNVPLSLTRLNEARLLAPGVSFGSYMVNENGSENAMIPKASSFGWMVKVTAKNRKASGILLPAESLTMIVRQCSEKKKLPYNHNIIAMNFDNFTSITPPYLNP